MRRLSMVLLMLVLTVTVALPTAQVAQDPPAPPAAPTPPFPALPALPQLPELPELPGDPPETPQAPEPPDDPETDVFTQTDIQARRVEGEAVRIAQDFTLRAGESVREVVVILGNASIDGEVGGDVVVVLGTARLGSSAVIGGDFVVVGGGASIEAGATVGRDAVVVGGALDAPTTFMPGGDLVVVGSMLLGSWVEGFVPYVSRGLAWGRLIVPNLPWVWAVVGFFFLVYLVLNLLFNTTVRTGADMLATKPLTAFGVGLLVLLLVGPASLLLAISVVGLIVIPFLFCALIAAGVLGKIAVARWMGMSMLPQASPDSRGQATGAFALGAVLLILAYMVPVFGILVWALSGVLGLGAASLAFFAAYRRENPLPPAQPAQSPPPMPLVPPGASDPGPTTEGAAPVAPPGGSLASMPRAWFRDRLAAFVLDVILVAIVANILDFDAGEIFLPLLLLYHVGFWTWKQTTVGGIICQLRLVRVDGTPLGFADALVRGLSSIFSLLVLGIGALWILRDPDHQAWHDKIAGTFVVKVPRNWPL